MGRNTTSRDAKRHPIQVTATRAGLTPDQLRAWERRYGAVEPARSEGGQRLYSDADVERLRLLRMAVDGGRRISEVASMSPDELAILVLEDEVEVQRDTDHPPVVDPFALVDCMDAIEALDGKRLEQILTQQLVSRGSGDLIEGLVAPLMYEVGRRWHDGELGIHHEHLATAVLRGTVARILADSQPQRPVGTIVLATTQGQRHEVGLLLAATVAAQHAWRVVYLGADLPARVIAEAVQQVGADLVGLSVVIQNEEIDDLQELRAVAENLPPEARVVVGGAAVEHFRAQLLAMGAECLDEPKELEQYLRQAEDERDD